MSPRRPASLPNADRESLRRHLVHSTAAVLRRKRTAVITVREIAAEAGVAVGLLYNHFADKDELVAAALLERGPAFAMDASGPLAAPGSASVGENLAAYATETIAVLREVLPIVLTAGPGLVAHIANAMHSGSGPHLVARDKLRVYLLAEQQLGRIAADADVDTAAMLITGALHELVMFAGVGPPADEAADATVVRRVVDFVTRSIS